MNARRLTSKPQLSPLPGCPCLSLKAAFLAPSHSLWKTTYALCPLWERLESLKLPRYLSNTPILNLHSEADHSYRTERGRGREEREGGREEREGGREVREGGRARERLERQKYSNPSQQHSRINQRWFP